MNREEILRRLIAEGVIDQEQAAGIRESSKSSDSEEIILGYVLGMTNEPARIVASALGKPTQEVANIEPRKTPFGRRLGGIFGSFENLFTAEGQQAIKEAGLADDLQQYFSNRATENRDITGERAEFEKELLNLIDNIRSQGLVGTDVLEAWEDRIKASPQVSGMGYTATSDRQRFREYIGILEEIKGTAGISDELTGGVDQYLGGTTLGADFQARELEDTAGDRPRVTDPQAELNQQTLAYQAGAQPLVEEDRGPIRYEDGVPIYEDAEARSKASREAARKSDPLIGFASVLQGLGLLEYDQEQEAYTQPSRSPLTSGLFPVPEEAIYDPSVGRWVSYAEVEAMRFDPQRLEQYAAEAPSPTSRYIQDRWDSGMFPEEDLVGIVPSLMPDDPWEAPLYTHQTGDAMAQWRSFSPEKRQLYTQVMVSQGLIDEALVPTLNYSDPLGQVQIAIWSQALGYSRDTQTNPVQGLYGLGQYAAAQRALAAAGSAGSVRQPFSVPAQYRTIPDYETLSQDVTDLVRSRLNGRDPEDWEVVLLADELERQHKDFNREMIEAAEDAYYDRSYDPDNPIRVPTPETRTRRVFENLYRPELERLDQVEDTEVSNALMINAITKGGQMVGGL